MNFLRTVKAVTCDVDGTLYSIQGMIWRNLFSMLPVMGFFRDLHKVRAGLRGQGPFEDFRAEQARRLASRLGTTPEQAARQVERVVDRHWMSVFRKVRPFRGVRPALEKLMDRGIPIALISDYPLGGKLEGMGLADLPFAARINSEEVGALKPHPAPFEKALRILGIDPGRALHLGDREEYDVAGSQAAGMRAGLFHRGFRPPGTRAEFTFSDWRQLAPRLRASGLIC